MAKEATEGGETVTLDPGSLVSAFGVTGADGERGRTTPELFRPQVGVTRTRGMLGRKNYI